MENHFKENVYVQETVIKLVIKTLIFWSKPTLKLYSSTEFNTSLSWTGSSTSFTLTSCKHLRLIKQLKMKQTLLPQTKNYFDKFWATHIRCKFRFKSFIFFYQGIDDWLLSDQDFFEFDNFFTRPGWCIFRKFLWVLGLTNKHFKKQWWNITIFDLTN